MSKDTSRTDEEVQLSSMDGWISPDFARQLERELAEARTALCHALNYCESTDGTKGPLMGSAIPDGVWQRLHAIAAGHARAQP